MLILALDSSTKMGSVALCENNNGLVRVIAEKSSERQRSHSEFLNSAVDEILKDTEHELSEIDLFATSQGPGSFTGLRVAGNIAKTFAYTFSRPLYVANSLQVLACQADFPDVCVSLLNAYKNMVFFALYRGENEVISPCALTLPELENKVLTYAQKNSLSSLPCVGEGLAAYESLMAPDLLRVLRPSHDRVLYPEAKTLAKLAVEYPNLGQTIEWNLYTPLYIKASAAEEKRAETKRNN